MPKPTLIIPDYVLTSQGLRGHTGVVVDGDSIVDVFEVGRQPPDASMEIVRLPGRALIPGLVNAHSHAFQRAIRGHTHWRAAGRSDFWSWRQAMYGAANDLSPEGIEAVSRLAFLEMVESGITSVGEFHYLHRQTDGTRYDDPDELANRVVAAALDVGLRICLLRVVYATGGIGEPLAGDQRRFTTTSPDEALAAVSRLSNHPDSRVQVGLAPHSIRAVPRAWLSELATFGGPVHAHVSEQPAENEACQQAYGLSPTRLFADAGLLGPRFNAVHLTFPEPGDLELLRDSGSRIVVCPTTELDLGDGFLPLEARQLPLAVGTDSQARIDLFEEARSLELHARAIAGRRNVLAPEGDRHGLARQVLRAATGEGARALGRSDRGIAPGAPADLVAIDLDRPAALGVPPLEAVAFSADPSWVDRVWVAGEEVVRGGLHPHRERVIAAARSYLSID